MRRITISLALGFTLLACNKASPNETGTRTNSAQAPQSPQGAAVAPIAADAHAAVGKPAPDFALKDLEGKEVRLSSFKGKVVVLEWFNPGCPFVKRAHTKGSLKETASKQTKNGVVWLAVNSSAPGKEGSGVSTNRDAAQTFAMAHPILVDEAGDVGKAYGATNTPHMFVIDDKGTLVYKGAIDNSPDGEGQSAPDGKLVSYVDEALAAVAAGKPVATAETKAYGCGVKYGK